MSKLVAFCVVAGVLLILFVLVSYVKTSPERALIVSGLRRKPKILIGRGGFRIPFFQRIDKLFLGQTSVDIKTSLPVPTRECVKVSVDAVAKIRVLNTPDGLQNAARNFLNMNASQIAMQVRDSLEGNMREVIGAITLMDLNINRDAFSDQIVVKAKPDMEKLGIEIISCNIQNITDDLGLIDKLGADKAAAIQKNAAIIKANAERDISVAQSVAKKEANDARVLNETDIAEKNNALAIRVAELKVQEDSNKAVADAAYEIKQQEQQKIINEKTVEAEASKMILSKERQKTINQKTVEAEIEKANQEQILTQKRIEIKRNELDAEVQKKADADKYNMEISAAAELEQRKRKAEAEAYEAEQRARAVRAQAEAEQFKMEQEAIGQKKLADAAAYKIQQEGIATAQAIEKKGLAEAEAMQKKADAFKKYGQAAMTQMIVERLPEIATAIASPMAAIDNVSIYGTTGQEVSGFTASTPIVMKQMIETVKNATGFDMTEVMKGETYDAKVNKNVQLQTDNKVDLNEQNED